MIHTPQLEDWSGAGPVTCVQSEGHHFWEWQHWYSLSPLFRFQDNIMFLDDFLTFINNNILISYKVRLLIHRM